MSKKLKPCPFCGSEAKACNFKAVGTGKIDVPAITCTVCQVNMIFDDGTKWNTRTGDKG